MVNALADRPAPLTAALGTRQPLTTARRAAAFGVLAFLVSFAGSWIPSFWGDEAASVMSAERPLPSLFAMLRTVDAVHGSYYLLLHFWIDLFGAGPLSVRLPSAIAVGLAAAGTVVLAEWLFSRRIAIITGVVCALLPRFTYMGAEARSYALSTAAAVWLTVLLVRLLIRRNTRRLAWLGYGVGLALCIYLFLYLVLLAIVHGILVLTTYRARTVLRRWSAATALGIVLAGPLIAFAIGERHQIEFLAHRHRVSFGLVVFGQWFGGAWLGILCWALILVACAAAARSWWTTRNLPKSPAVSGWRGYPSGMVLLLCWLVAPTTILLVGNAGLQPMYTNRYLSFCAPAAAILVALGIAALPRNWARITALLAFVALVVPGYIAQRTEFGKPGGSDWAKVSEVIGQNAKPGDAIVFDQSVKASWRPRLAMHLYPDDYKGLDDVALLTPFDQTSGLWDAVAPLATVQERLATVSKVWALETTLSHESAANSDLHVLERDGFGVAQRIRINRTIIYEFTRSTP